jgi:hypothetical protein
MALTAKRPSKNVTAKQLSDLKDKPEKVRFNADIPRSLMKKIKMRAFDEELTQTDLAVKAFKEYLSK